MLSVCCSDNGARCRAGPECCEEKLEGALSRLSFDEIRRLIQSEAGPSVHAHNSAHAAESSNQESHIPAGELSTSEAVGSSLVGHVPGKASQWRLIHLEASNYIQDDVQSASDDTDAFKGYVSSEGIDQRALKTAAAATVQAQVHRTTPRDTTPRVANSTGSADPNISYASATAFLDSLSDDLLLKAVSPATAELQGHSSDAWSVKSEDPPGPCSKSTDIPTMIIEQGYRFDHDGFCEVGTLDSAEDALHDEKVWANIDEVCDLAFSPEQTGLQEEVVFTTPELQAQDEPIPL